MGFKNDQKWSKRCPKNDHFLTYPKNDQKTDFFLTLFWSPYFWFLLAFRAENRQKLSKKGVKKWSKSGQNRDFGVLGGKGAPLPPYFWGYFWPFFAFLVIFVSISPIAPRFNFRVFQKNRFFTFFRKCDFFRFWNFIFLLFPAIL